MSEMSIAQIYPIQYSNINYHQATFGFNENINTEYEAHGNGVNVNFNEILSMGKSKVKTSLCKKYADTGNCPYGFKCQFAHGLVELRCNVDENSYKTKPCNSYFKKGYCVYGDRCNFSHKTSEHKIPVFGYRSVMQETKNISLVLGIQMGEQQTDVKSIGSTQQSKSQSSAFNQRFVEQNCNIINGNIAHCHNILDSYLVQNMFSPIIQDKVEQGIEPFVSYISQLC